MRNVSEEDQKRVVVSSNSTSFKKNPPKKTTDLKWRSMKTLHDPAHVESHDWLKSGWGQGFMLVALTSFIWNPKESRQIKILQCLSDIWSNCTRKTLNSRVFTLKCSDAGEIRNRGIWFLKLSLQVLHTDHNMTSMDRLGLSEINPLQKETPAKGPPCRIQKNLLADMEYKIHKYVFIRV